MNFTGINKRLGYVLACIILVTPYTLWFFLAGVICVVYWIFVGGRKPGRLFEKLTVSMAESWVKVGERL